MNTVFLCQAGPGWAGPGQFHLLDDLLQFPVLPLQLPGLLLVVVVGGRAGLQSVLLLRLPLTARDETPHLDGSRDRKSVKKGQHESINNANDDDHVTDQSLSFPA